MLLVFGSFIRLVFVPLPGFKADMAFWKGWGLAVADKGIIWLVQNTNYNYPPGFAYVLYGINKIYALFANPYDLDSYWSASNIVYLFIFKALIICADIGIAILIIKIAHHFKSKFALICAALYFFNPAVLFDGVIWGQVDQIGLFVFLVALYYIVKDKIHSASVFFALSFLLKFQNIIFIPIFFLYVYKRYGWEKLIASISSSAATCLLVSIPFVLTGTMGSLVHLLTVNNNYFPYLSLNAFNGWWLYSGLQGMKYSDAMLFFGIMDARTFSILLFACMYALSCLAVLVSKKETSIRVCISALLIILFSFFHIMTQSHERYLFHMLGFIPLLTVFYSGFKRKQLYIFYILSSLFFFLNMYLTMYFNYPDQVIWFFSPTGTQTVTALLSVGQIALFLYFFIFFFLPEIKQYQKITGGILGILLVALISYNVSYIMGKPISLTKLRPTHAVQDYYVPVMNKSLNAAFDPFRYDRVSSNYYFYNNSISSHANSQIEYRVGKRFRVLRTDYGIDVEGSAQAAVYFNIIGDGRVLFRSKKIGRYDNPRTVEVNITGVDQLVLVIERDTKDNNGFHADWLNPIVIR